MVFCEGPAANDVDGTLLRPIRRTVLNVGRMNFEGSMGAICGICARIINAPQIILGRTTLIT
jgi:hypothetical protein